MSFSNQHIDISMRQQNREFYKRPLQTLLNVRQHGCSFFFTYKDLITCLYTIYTLLLQIQQSADKDGSEERCYCGGGSEGQGRGLSGRCSLESWVFKSFLKIDRYTSALVALCGSFHHHRTIHEKSLNCPKHIVYIASQQCYEDQTDQVLSLIKSSFSITI